MAQPVDPQVKHDDPSLAEVGAFLVERRFQIARASVLLALVVAIVVLSGGKKFSASFTFFPRIAGATSGISGIAAQLGLSVPGVDISQTPSFYPELVRSRSVLGEVVDSTVLSTATSLDYAAILSVDEDSAAFRREQFLERLRDVISASVSPRTGVVRVSVTVGNPDASVDLARSLERVVERFIVESRQSQASAERRFSELRLGAAQGELFAAENALRDFVTRNRLYEQAAETRLEADRLQRAITLRHGVFVALQQTIEQARIEEARDTPTISFVDHAERPVYADRRRLFLKTLAGLLGGLLAAAAVLVLLSSGADLKRHGGYSVRDAVRVIRADVLTPRVSLSRLLGLR